MWTYSEYIDVNSVLLLNSASFNGLGGRRSKSRGHVRSGGPSSGERHASARSAECEHLLDLEVAGVTVEPVRIPLGDGRATVADDVRDGASDSRRPHEAVAL